MWYDDEEDELQVGRCSENRCRKDLDDRRSPAASISASISILGAGRTDDCPSSSSSMSDCSSASCSPLLTPSASPSPNVSTSMISYSRRNTLELPRNLYIAAPGLLGMGAPTCAEHIHNLHYHYNVKVVINLRESPNREDWFEGLPVRSVHLPVPGYCAPSMETVLGVLRLCALVHGSDAESGDDDGASSDEDRSVASPSSSPVSLKRGAVAVHCLEGKGRTGTICAAYLLYQRRDLTAEDVIEYIRSQSPLSIESREQEEFLHLFASLRHQMSADAGYVCESRGSGSFPDDTITMETYPEGFSWTQNRCAMAQRRGKTESFTSSHGNNLDGEDEQEGGSWYC